MPSRKRKKIRYFEITREEERDDTKGLRGLLTTRDVLATYSDRARTGHNKSSSDKPATKSEIGWKSAWEGAHRSPSVCQKLRKLLNCSRRRRKVHNSKEACSSLTFLADARVTKKMSTESNPGGRVDAKDQRPEREYTPTPLKEPKKEE